MTIRLLSAVTIASVLVAGSAFAADTPVPTPPTAPPATSAATMSVGPVVAAPTATTSPTPATKADGGPISPAISPEKSEMAVGQPVAQRRHVSACTRSIEKAEKMLARSDASPENIAKAWQRIEAAKDARLVHQANSCESESRAALMLLQGSI